MNEILNMNGLLTACANNTPWITCKWLYIKYKASVGKDWNSSMQVRNLKGTGGLRIYGEYMKNWKY